MDVLRRYIPETFKHPWLLLGAILSTLIMSAFELVTPLYLRNFFNTISHNEASPAVVQILLGLVLMIGFLYFGGLMVRRIQFVCVEFLEIPTRVRLYNQALTYLLQHSQHFFNTQFSGSLTRRISKYTDGFDSLWRELIYSLLPTALFILGSTAILYTRNHALGIILIVWIIVFLVFNFTVLRLRQPLRAARAEADSKIVGTLADIVSNQNTIALFSAVPHEGNILHQAVSMWRRAAIRTSVSINITWTLQDTLTLILEVALLYKAVLLWNQGLLAVGDFILIQSYLLITFGFLNSLNSTLRHVYDAFDNGGEMVAILNTPHEIQDVAGAKELKVSGGNVVFDAVDFRFHENRSILENLSVAIQGGQKVALVGPSGAGKSTITKLLLRLYDVKSGSITIDGHNISKVTQESLRNNIGFVPQEPILFHRTLMENIRYGKRDANDEEVIEAARLAHCHEFIAKLSQGYDTLVGERGVKLSGGERQRVAIARAILKDAPILILDEATSSLDSESEQYIQEALKVLMQGKTVLVIAHRLSTIMNMDRIVVIDDGRVEADGTHVQLLEQDGLYQKLWNIQAGGFITDEEENIVE